MGSCIACCACQAVSCCVGEMCRCCGKAVEGSSVCVRIFYGVLLFLVTLVSFLLNHIPVWTNNNFFLSKLWSTYVTCPTGDNSCFGDMATFRVTAAAAVFHLLLALIMIGVKTTKDPRTQIQNSWWILKIPILIGLMVGFFFVPNIVFVYYGYIALAGSFVFIILQLVYLVDFAHSWNENWIAKYEETGSKCYAVGLVSITLILYVLSFVGSVLMYVYWELEGKECWINSMFISLNLIFCFAISMVSIHPKLQEKNPRIGLFQAAIVTAYSTYTVFSAISSEPETMNCSKNPSFLSNGSTASMVIGLLITFVVVIYSALTTSSNLESENQKLLDDKKEKREDQLKTPTDVEEQTEQIDEVVPYSFTFFHLTFFLASMYLCMILTEWVVVTVGADYENGNNQVIDANRSIAAVWVKIVSGWVTLVIYFWSLIAPAVFPNRQFY